MKLLLLSSVVLLLATSAIGQEEVTTTLAPADSPDAPKESATEAPAPVETTTAAAEAAKTEAPSEEKPTTEEKKDETSETNNKADEAKQPAEEEAGEGAPASPAQEPPKFVFVTQHFRDPITGVVYSRQVPLIPSTYLRPLPSESDVRQQKAPPSQQEPSQQPSFDPLGQYSEQQKKRQFYQDMIMTQLTRFEKEIEPMLESEQNMTQKNDMEELLGTVAELKQKLESHQIFNISEIMNNWKEGKLADGQGEPQPPPTNEPPRGAPVGVLPSPPPQVAYSRQPQMTLRTVILVPQTRHQQHQQPQQPPMQPQYQPQYNPYAAMTRQVPVIHIRRSPYQAAMFAPVPEGGRQTDRVEPQSGSGGEGEYSNTNDIFGY